MSRIFTTFTTPGAVIFRDAPHCRFWLRRSVSAQCSIATPIGLFTTAMHRFHNLVEVRMPVQRSISRIVTPGPAVAGCQKVGHSFIEVIQAAQSTASHFSSDSNAAALRKTYDGQQRMMRIWLAP